MTDALLERLAAANPVASTATPEPELAALLATVLGDAAPSTAGARGDRRGPRRGASAHGGAGRRPVARRLRRGAAAALLIAVAGVATAGATTHWFGAHTGRSAATVEPGDSGEILRNHGAGIDAIIDRYARDIPLPPGASFDDFKARTAADEAANESTTGLRASMEFVATCGWTTSWLAAFARGDATAMARAVRVLRDGRNWPATRLATAAGDEPTRITIANAAARGEAATVRRLRRANCAP